jgi:hypothetical protein
LDFHHKKKNKNNFGIGKNRHKSYDKLKKEAKKCILICANCHREKHFLKKKP